MAKPDPNLPRELTGCDAAIPSLATTRQFDFGQFIRLFDPGIDPANPKRPAPTFAHRDRAFRFTRSSEPNHPIIAISKVSSAEAIAQRRDGIPQGMSLMRLLELGSATVNQDAPLNVTVTDVPAFVNTGNIEHAGNTYRIQDERDHEWGVVTLPSMTSANCL